MAYSASDFMDDVMRELDATPGEEGPEGAAKLALAIIRGLRPTRETDKLAGARSQAMAQYDSIVEMLRTLEVARDDDAFREDAKELAEAAGYTVYGFEEDGDNEAAFSYVNKAGKVDETRYSDEDEAWIAACEDNDLRPSEDDARQAIEEDALSVEVRSDWELSASEFKAAEFRILLCTGGPAVQIRGELDQYGQPDRAWLECQDWFTTWTQVFGGGTDPKDPGSFARTVSQDTLLEFASVFYFGE